MENFNKSSKMGKQLIFSFIKERMKERKMSQIDLARAIGVNESTLIRNFKGDTEMLLSTLLKVCGALELRPYFIPAELDNTEITKTSFN